MVDGRVDLTPERDAILREGRNAVLATRRPRGGPQLSPVWFQWDGEVVRVSTVRGTAKVRNIRRDPEVSLCVEDAKGDSYVAVYGQASVIDGDAVREETFVLLRKYVTEEEVAPFWERINRDGDRVVIVVRAESVVGR
jgi:PPOX class probable F420-dependent enzyme